MIDHIEATLNRMVAFSSGTSSLDVAVDLQNTAHILEATDKIPNLTETCMSLCVDLLENSLPHTVTVYSVMVFLARCCIREENRGLAVRFGVVGLCILILQDHKSLSEEMLFITFDLIGTLSMSDGSARRMLRPSIPYVAAVLKDRADSYQLMFGGAVVIATLTMLDAANATLAAEQECIQLLISSFIRAYDKKKQILQQRVSTNPLRKRREEEEVRLCDNVMRWSRDALQKLIYAPFSVIDEKLKAADFGEFGARVEVDELKWLLTLERRKVKFISS